MSEANDKLDKLRTLLKNYGSCLVAYSGGVDSVFLARVAHEVLGNRALATDSLAKSVSALAAIGGFSYEENRARQLVRELLRCDLPYASPRGHPTMIQWSFSELERKFG